MAMIKCAPPRQRAVAEPGVVAVAPSSLKEQAHPAHNWPACRWLLGSGGRRHHEEVFTCLGRGTADAGAVCSMAALHPLVQGDDLFTRGYHGVEHDSRHGSRPSDKRNIPIWLRPHPRQTGAAQRVVLFGTGASSRPMADAGHLPRRSRRAPYEPDGHEAWPTCASSASRGPSVRNRPLRERLAQPNHPRTAAFAPGVAHLQIGCRPRRWGGSTGRDGM